MAHAVLQVSGPNRTESGSQKPSHATRKRDLLVFSTYVQLFTADNDTGMRISRDLHMARPKSHKRSPAELKKPMPICFFVVYLFCFCFYYVFYNADAE